MSFSSRVTTIRPLEAQPWYGRPESDSMDVHVELADGSGHVIVVETPDQAERLMDNEGEDFVAGLPALIVRRADQQVIDRAIAALAAELSGYWLRLYGNAPRTSGTARPTSISLAASGGSGVIRVALADGRRFELLAAEPRWFAGELARLGLDFYFGTPIVFLRRLDEELARAAVANMTEVQDSLLCLYDRPGGSLPALLEEFRGRHFQGTPS